MSQTHTIVVRFPEGIVPRYRAATEFQGGHVVAIDFDGNRLTVAQELEEALEAMLEDGVWAGCDWIPSDGAKQRADAALARARGES